MYTKDYYPFLADLKKDKTVDICFYALQLVISGDYPSIVRHLFDLPGPFLVRFQTLAGKPQGFRIIF